MKKINHFIKSSKGTDLDGIFFYKNEDGTIHIHMGYSELDFTVKETKEIVKQLQECTKE